MHIYIYDSFINQTKYNKALMKVEIRITDLGLNGKIIRLGLMKSLYNLLETELDKLPKTIVLVGDDNLFHQAINCVAKLKKTKKIDVPLAFIPFGKNNHISFLLGINSPDEACTILSARRKETFDLGIVNDHYFLSEAEISTENTTIEIDKNYSIEILRPGVIKIINITNLEKLPKQIKPKANDNILELYIESHSNSFFKNSKETYDNSLFSFKEITIKNEKKEIEIDKNTNIRCPAKIMIAKEKIDFIIGKTNFF